MSAVLLRSLLVKQGYVRNCEEIQVGAASHGKPYLRGSGQPYFNLSHSGEWVVCALDADNEVGVDIECMQPIDHEWAEAFFSQEEYKKLTELPREHKSGYFYDIWTMKESYLKAVGVGLSAGLNTVTVTKAENGIQLRNEEGRFLSWHVKQLQLDEAYRLAVCYRTHLESKVQVVSMGEIVSIFLECKS